ncbi:MAG: 2-oxo acid dehydrogenase subunit E2 [Chloroflexi bacterium]|nr:2-oxo acid dehydrogenase subunit E2 [Chloroflexota bacterium]
MTNASLSPRGLPIKETVPLGRVRRVMAQTMHESVQRAALSQISREMDLTELQSARRGATGDAKLSLNVYVLAAVARTLPRHPLLNAELVEDKIVVYEPINLGVAIAVSDGLIVAVIREADEKSLIELAKAAEDLSARARAGRLTYADIEGGTFTVSNLGMYGVDGGFPLPRPPEGAILLIGRSQPRPAVVDGAVTIRDLAWFSLSYDHRFIDGATAARFLDDLQSELKETM